MAYSEDSEFRTRQTPLQAKSPRIQSGAGRKGGYKYKEDDREVSLWRLFYYSLKGDPGSEPISMGTTYK
jgi:hypothetical protein